MEKIRMAEIKLTDREIDAAVSVLRSGALRQGVHTESLEAEFAEYCEAPYAVASSSGTAALHLAYRTFIKPGDEVLVPSFTFIATASTVELCGGRPVFCDVDPETFLIDLEDAGKKITEHTKAISPVHLFGNPCPIDQIQKFSKDHGLIVVWDAAQAHGSRFNGTDVGAFGDFACYSFYPSKNMFVGEGGITTCSNKEHAEYMKRVRSHGEHGKYTHIDIGFNYRMTDVEASIGRIQLERLCSMIEIRRNNAHALDSGLLGVPGITIQKTTSNCLHSYHQYSILVDGGKFGCNRDDLALYLKAKGIDTGIHYPRGLHQQPVFMDLYGIQQLPVTERLAKQIIALPVHHGLRTNHAEKIAEEIVNIHRTMGGL